MSVRPADDKRTVTTKPCGEEIQGRFAELWDHPVTSIGCAEIAGATDADGSLEISTVAYTHPDGHVHVSTAVFYPPDYTTGEILSDVVIPGY